MHCTIISSAIRKPCASSKFYTRPPLDTFSVTLRTFGAKESATNRLDDRFRNAEANKRESRAVARKPRDAAAALFGLKLADNIHYKSKKSQSSKARLQRSKRIGAKTEFNAK